MAPYPISTSSSPKVEGPSSPLEHKDPVVFATSTPVPRTVPGAEWVFSQDLLVN